MARDPYRYFRVEARELLDQLGKGILDLEKGSGAAALVPQLLRLTHTLKGAARVVRQREIADQAHAIEGMLAPYRESPATAVPRDCIDAILKLGEGIAGNIDALALPADDQAAAPGRPAAEKTLRTVRADIAEMDALLDGIAETHAQMKALRGSLAAVERARFLVDILARQEAPRQHRDGGRPAADRTSAVAEELGTIFGGFERGLATALDRMDRELKQVRDAAEQLRLVPAAVLFTPLELAVRDSAQALGKRVVFEARGGEMRLDAHVLGAVQGALQQMVRNAVAHGIEPESERRISGKPGPGRVTLEVERRGRRIIFRCSDDGLGVDLEAVRRAVQRKGMLSLEISTLGAEALLRLLLQGGISTSGAVSEVAGRGIGLDLVRVAVEQLGGEVGVRTAQGTGTAIELVVPLSVASLEALLVESAGTLAVIPLDTVKQSLRVAAADVVKTAQGESVLHDGKVIPFVRLSRVLRQSAAAVRGGRPWSAVIVEGTAGVAAVGVDRLLGTANVVLRPLPDFAPASPVVAGASLDADGNPQLVLDVDGIVAQANHAEAPESAAAAPPIPILVIDDSLTTRMLEQSILESAGFEVGMATSGEEGLAAARSKRYSLFLVDVEMPGMDGFTFIEHVRADPLLRDTPAILITSRGSAEDRQRGKDAGAQRYIVKSEFDQVAFLDQIRQLVA